MKEKDFKKLKAITSFQLEWIEYIESQNIDISSLPPTLNKLFSSVVKTYDQSKESLSNKLFRPLSLESFILRLNETYNYIGKQNHNLTDFSSIEDLQEYCEYKVREILMDHESLFYDLHDFNSKVGREVFNEAHKKISNQYPKETSSISVIDYDYLVNKEAMKLFKKRQENENYVKRRDDYFIKDVTKLKSTSGYIDIIINDLQDVIDPKDQSTRIIKSVSAIKEDRKNIKHLKISKLFNELSQDQFIKVIKKLFLKL